VAGGRPGNQTCLEAYDPVSNTWERKASMPTGRSGIAAAVVADCLYVFGGEGNVADPNGIFHEVEAYDPVTDQWFELPPMRTGRHGIYAAVRNGVVYLPGGSTVQGLGPTDVNEAYVIDVSETVPRQSVVTTPRTRPAPRPRPRE
jgi:N-acetylneuraminic acid mutarotase